jgi:hypothetical protein
VLIFPFSLLYFKEVLEPGRPRMVNLWLLLPLVLYIVDYFPFFVQYSAGEKLAIARSLNGYGVKVEYREGWFIPAGGHNLIRNLAMAGIWIAQFSMFRKHTKPGLAYEGASYVHFKWLKWLLLTQPLMFLPTLITLVFQKPILMASIANVAGLISVLLQGYFLLLHPELLYGQFIEKGKIAPESNQLSGPANSNASTVEPFSEPSPEPQYLNSVDEDTLNHIQFFWKIPSPKTTNT